MPQLSYYQLMIELMEGEACLTARSYILNRCSQHPRKLSVYGHIPPMDLWSVPGNYVDHSDC
jgi:hypothetical protein